MSTQMPEIGTKNPAKSVKHMWSICKNRNVYTPYNQELKQKQSRAASTLSSSHEKLTGSSNLPADLNWTLWTVEPSSKQPSSQAEGLVFHI